MAKKIFYRTAVTEEGTAGQLVILFATGYASVAGGTPASLDVPASPITSLNTAISKGMSFARKLQGEGLNVRVTVYGQVFDAAAPAAASGLAADPNSRPVPATPSYQMTVQEQAEQLYAQIDTPERGLTQRIHANNRSASGSVAFDPNFTEDPTGA